MKKHSNKAGRSRYPTIRRTARDIKQGDPPKRRIKYVYVCPFCDKKYRIKDNLASHIRLNHCRKHFKRRGPDRKR